MDDLTKYTPEQRDAIFVHGQNALISAGAGSGKTTVLVERIIQLIKDAENPISIDEMLVMTFTKAAAENMKVRLRNRLKKDKLNDQLKKLDSSYICTIDSFTSSMVRKYNYLLGVQKDISILPKNIETAKKKEILRNIFDRKYLERDPKFLDLFDRYCFKDDEPLMDLIFSLNNSLDKKIDKLDYLNNYFSHSYTDKWYENVAISFEKYLSSRKKELKKLIEAFLDQISDDSKNKSLTMTILNSIVDTSSYDELKKTLESITRLPSIGTGDKLPGFDAAKTPMTDLIKKLRALTQKPTIFEAIKVDEKTIQSIKCMVEILIELENELIQYKQKYQVFTFDDISLMTINLFKNHPEIASEVRDGFKIIMIDEYQDTSDTQDTIVKYIGNNNVYMVGDVKQSIYRFRKANPEIFKDKYDSYDKYDPLNFSKKGAVIDLLQNFRSRKEVVDDVNKIFDVLMTNEVGGADYMRKHQMISGNRDYEKFKDPNQNYSMEIINYQNIEDLMDESIKLNKDEKEAIIIAKDIKKKLEEGYKIFDGKQLNPCVKNDFCIILEKTNAFDTYRKIFDYYGIPLNIWKDEKLNDGIDLNIIVNVMNFILKISRNEFDNKLRYLFMSIGRSFLGRYDDQYLYDCVKDKSFELIKKDAIYSKAMNIASQLNCLTAKEFVQMIIDEYDFYNHYIGFDSIDKAIVEVEYLMENAKQIENIGMSIEDVVAYFEMIKDDDSLKEEYKLNVGDKDAVTLINTHKSKGLEYSVCYFAGFNSKYNVNDKQAIITLDDDYGFVYTKENKDEKLENFYSDMFKYKYDLENISERIRLFYVALTRTKEKMIFVDSFDANEIPVIDPEMMEDYKVGVKCPHGLLNLVYSELADKTHFCNLDVTEFTDQYKYSANKKDDSCLVRGDEEEIKIVDLELNNTIDNKNVSRFSKKKFGFIDAKTKEKLEFGEQVHYYLEMINFQDSVQNIEKAIDEYDASPMIKNKLKAFIQSDLVANINQATIYKEHEFISEEGVVGIIDLLLEYENEFVIVDYKLKNIEDEAYHKQLEGYAKYIQMNNPENKKVSAYLYSIIDEKYEKII